MKRRTVLQGALAGSVVTAVPVAGSGQASAVAPVGSVGAEAGALQVVRGPAGQAVRVPADLGLRITVATRSARVRMTLSYDGRLYAAAPRPVIVRGTQVLPVPVRRAKVSTYGRALDLWLPELEPGEYTLQAGGGRSARFPADLVADPVPTEVKVTDATGAVSARVLSQPIGTQAQPWGAVLGAGWQQAGWGDGYFAWYPALVTLRSVGPAPLPAGSQVRLTLDRQVFESLRIAALPQDGVRTRGVGRRTERAGQPVATWTLHTAVAAGARISLSCAPAVRALRAGLDHVEPPLVEFVAPRQFRDTQRLTGQETQTRADDVYSAVTRSLFAPS